MPGKAEERRKEGELEQRKALAIHLIRLAAHIHPSLNHRSHSLLDFSSLPLLVSYFLPLLLYSFLYVSFFPLSHSSYLPLFIIHSSVHLRPSG